MNAQAEWDRSGFSCAVSARKNQTKRIFVMLDLEYGWYKNQTLTRHDLIITHHPVLFAPTPLQTRMHEELKAIGAGLLSLHTNFDFHDRGMNVEFARIFAASQIVNRKSEGCFVALRAPMKLRTIVNLINSSLAPMQLVYDRFFQNRKFTGLVVVLGSGAGLMPTIFQPGDPAHQSVLYVTGDMK